jgi:hypothetical protein
MNAFDKCSACGHDWHGGSLCSESCRVLLDVEPILGFDSSGAGPVDAWALASRAATATEPRVFTGSCACRGAA